MLDSLHFAPQKGALPAPPQQDLKELVGPERYTLLMGFLPLTSAISGNVGLQASSLTTRAISHGCPGGAAAHVLDKNPQVLMHWILM